jgi:Polysaccharide pyruvyl transferase
VPDLNLVTGQIDAQGRGSNPALEMAVASADVMVIGSGAGILEPLALTRFHARTGKPVGMFGITTDAFNFTYFNDGESSADVKALRAASFVFTRERTSLRLLAGEDVDGPGGASQDDPSTSVNEAINREPIKLRFDGLPAAFVPDTTFAFAERDDAAAAAFMRAKGLESGKFVCFVPRHRWTPTGTRTRQGDSRDVYNALYLKADHDKLKVAITRYVRDTGHKVALVPETLYVVDLLASLMKDGLPPDVADRVVVRENYWLPDEAASLFAQAQAVISIENHSPILAAAVGTPFLMVHQPEDSIKADMFADIGLADWYVHDINQVSGEDIANMLMAIVKDMPAARARLARAMVGVRARHAFGMQRLRAVLGL